MKKNKTKLEIKNKPKPNKNPEFLMWLRSGLGLLVKCASVYVYV